MCRCRFSKRCLLSRRTVCSPKVRPPYGLCKFKVRMLTARRSPTVQCAIIRGNGSAATNGNDRGQDADRSSIIGKHGCPGRGSPNFCARHATGIVRSSRNDALHAASGIWTYHCRFNICPRGTFHVGLTVSLAVLNVIDSDVETKVIATPSIFAVLSLTHLGCGAGMSGCAGSSSRQGAVRTR
jgi:hypothetical protein